MSRSSGLRKANSRSVRSGSALSARHERLDFPAQESRRQIGREGAGTKYLGRFPLFCSQSGDISSAARPPSMSPELWRCSRSTATGRAGGRGRLEPTDVGCYVSPVNRGPTGRRRSGKPQFRAQARPGSFFELARGTRGLVAGRSIACQGVKRRSNSTVKRGTAVVFSELPGPWSVCSANCSPCGWRWTSICFSGPSTSQHSFTPAAA